MEIPQTNVRVSSPPFAAPAETPRQVPATALVSRSVDFWLLGGLSIVAWCMLRVLQPFVSPDAPPTLGNFARTYVGHLAGAGAIASLLVNYPHFMASYRMAYAPGLAHVRHHWFALIAVPAALLAAITVGWMGWSAGAGAVAPLASAFTTVGLQSPFPEDVTIGAATMVILIQLLLLATGWHYGKQAYGACLVYARYDGYPLDDAQRALLRWTIHAIWLSTWADRLSPLAAFEHHGVDFRALGIPGLVRTALVVGTAVLLAGVLVFVVFANHRRAARLPSANTAVPFLAFVVWWFPPLHNQTFTSTLVPIFHALQYMVFVARVEGAGVAGRSEGTAHAKLTLVAFGLVIAGAFAFELAPRYLDSWTGSAASTQALFFMAGASLFLNLHHYCIDAAIWRMRDARVRDVLFFRTS